MHDFLRSFDWWLSWSRAAHLSDTFIEFFFIQKWRLRSEFYVGKKTQRKLRSSNKFNVQMSFVHLRECMLCISLYTNRYHQNTIQHIQSRHLRLIHDTIWRSKRWRGKAQREIQMRFDQKGGKRGGGLGR